jgi:hypothetical protein
VVVNAEYESSHFDAVCGFFRDASLCGRNCKIIFRPNAPTISIKGPEGIRTYPPYALRIIGAAQGCFADLISASQFAIKVEVGPPKSTDCLSDLCALLL